MPEFRGQARVPALRELSGKSVKDVYEEYGDGPNGGDRKLDDSPGWGEHRIAVVRENAIETIPRGSDYSVFYHELGHFVRLSMLNPEEQQELKVLFERAKARKQFLDQYSSTNVEKYFAQGFEAVLSGKRIRSRLFFANEQIGPDIADLIRSDSDLFLFIKKFIESSTITSLK